MKQKLIASLLVIVMVASTLTAIGMTATPVAAATATKATLSVSKTTPIINEPVTFTVALKKWNAATRSYVPLAKKYVTVFHTFNGVTYKDVTLKTNANGNFAFIEKFGSTGPRYYYATFAGDSSYATSMSVITAVTVQKIPATTTISVSKTNPVIGQSVTFTAQLLKWTGKTWVPMSRQSKPQLKIIHYVHGVMVTDVAKTTDANGKITWTKSWSSTGSTTYYATFAGDTLYLKSTSSAVTITVQKIPTTLTITVSKTNPVFVSEFVKVTITLKGGSTGLSKPLKIFELHNPQPPILVKEVNTVNGVWSDRVQWGESGKHTYRAEFAGDSRYAASAGTITVDVQKVPTTTTITPSKTNPAVNERVTFTITLKGGSTGLSKPMIYGYTWVELGEGITRAFNTVNGVYTFTDEFANAGHYTFFATFAGDSEYGPSSDTVTVYVSP